MVPEATPEAVRAVPWLERPYADGDGALFGSIRALLVQTRTQKIVVDPCIGNMKQRSTALFSMLETDFIERLAGTPFAPEHIDLVVCTHLHMDHVGWNTRLVDNHWVPTFPNARYVFGRRDYEYYAAKTDPGRKQMFADSVAPIVDAGRAEFVAMNAQLCPEVRLIPTAGHSPGHVSIEIASEGKRAVITGDVLHSPVQIAHPEWSSSLDADPDGARTTRRNVLETYADTGTLVVGTHFAAPGAGYVVRDGETFRFETDFGASGSPFG